MGEARRRSSQGLPPRPTPSGKGTKNGQQSNWWNLDRSKADRFVSLTTRGAWIGIGALAAFWVTVRFIGPAAGWWTLADG